MPEQKWPPAHAAIIAEIAAMKDSGAFTDKPSEQTLTRMRELTAQMKALGPPSEAPGTA